MSTTNLWPERIKIITIPAGGRTLRIDKRNLGVALGFLVIALLVGCFSLTVGESDVSIPEVLAALGGHGSEGIERIVVQWRLPRVLLALLAGAALAIGGGVFQTLTGNPLGSPDIIGFNTGAYTGALIGMLVLGASHTGSVIGALVGGLGTAMLVYFLALRRGLAGYRLIVIGIGVSALLGSVNAYLLLTARLETAISAAVWGAGSINTATWADVLPVGIALLLATPLLVFLSASMRMLPLGDDAARSRGVRVGHLRIYMILIGVGLTATVVAVAGPISFVALVAPQIALRLTRSPAIPLFASALLGAALLVISDLLARTIIAPSQLPVGTVTVVLGGCYLVWLLISRSRKTAS